MNRDRTPADDPSADLLARLRPQSRIDEVWPEQRHDAAHQQVLARIADDRPDVARSAGRSPHRRAPRPVVRRPWFTLAAAAGAAAAVAVIAITAPGATDRPEPPRPAATAQRPAPGATAEATAGIGVTSATFLYDVALVAAEQPDEHRDAPFWYTRALVDSTPDQLGPLGKPYVREDWSGRSSGHRFVSSTGGEVWDGAVWDDETSYFIGFNRYTWDQLDDVPTDPVSLRALYQPELDDYGASPDSNVDQHLWQAVGDMLRDTPAPPALRRGLYELLATIPDVTVQEGVTDAVGRPGTLVTHVNKTTSSLDEVLVDPTTGRLLQERNDTYPRGGSFYQRTYLAQGGVDDDHATLPDD